MANKKGNGFDDGSYVVKKSRKLDIFVFIICLLISFAIWLYASQRAEELPQENPTETESEALSETTTDAL